MHQNTSLSNLGPFLFSAFLGIVVFPLSAQVIADTELYEREIKPLLAEKCAACHGALKQESGLRLDYGQGIHAGGDSGPVIDTASTEDSELLARIRTEDSSLRMPPENEGAPLDEADIKHLQEWIEQGASFPESEQAPAGPQEHWAYQSVSRPAVPRIETTSKWATTNPIDAFVLHKLTERSMEALGVARPEVRIRRLYFDLIGLPPTPEQVAEFVTDPTPENWENTIDHLLDQHAHGERWARHWMDVWRYSDWDGFKNNVRGSQRHIWRWRDWIVDSLNSDKGYDRMLVEMLAGDEVAPKDPLTLRATGFLARNFHHSNRNMWLDATVEHTAKAFMATTLNCARCHDHKYDPLSQESFYAFRAIFEPHQVRTERVPGQPNITKDGLVRAYDASLNDPTYLYVGGNEKQPDKSHAILPDVPEILGGEYEPSRIALPSQAFMPNLKTFIEQEEVQKQRDSVAKAEENLRLLEAEENAEDRDLRIAKHRLKVANTELAALQARWQVTRLRHQERAPWFEAARRAENLEQALDVAHTTLQLLERQKKVDNLEEQLEQKAEEKDAELTKKLNDAKKELAKARNKKKQLSKARGDRPPRPAKYTPVGQRYANASTGRRLALAKWLVQPSNPLTSRVAVNYIWMHHIGEPLVDSVDDFGMRCAEPVHRELLDWLASELIASNWSLKHIHRLILSSRVYQLASSPSKGTEQVWEANSSRDPANQLLWRGNIRRLDAEAIRDSLLCLSGNLEYSIGGPEIDYTLGETNYRRSIYFRTAYEKQMTMMVVFDAASPNECYRRSPSVIPQQALALANSTLALDQAREIAAKILRNATDQEDAGQAGGKRPLKPSEWFVRRAFQVLLSRECTQSELDTCIEFLEQQELMLTDKKALQLIESKRNGKTTPAADPQVRARENLIHALINHNDFVTVR